MLVKLLITALCVPYLWAAYSPAQAKSLIDENSYEVTTIVRHLNLDGPGIKVDEKYSHEQARGLVKLRYEIEPEMIPDQVKTDKSLSYDGATFYSSGIDHISLVMNAGVCRKGDDNELLKALDLDFGPVKLDAFYDHVVGPMRWVHYIAKNRKDMKRDTDEGSIMVHNILSAGFHMDLNGRNGEDVIVKAFFEEDALFNEQVYQSIPHRIVFVHGEGMTAIDLHGIKILQSKGDTLSHKPSFSNDPELDAFTLMPMTGCSGLLAAESGKSLFELRKDSSSKRQFSFRAHVNRVAPNSQSYELDLTVAFDSPLDMLRVDMESPQHALRRSMTLFNFKAGQRSVFNVVKNVRRDAIAQLNQVLDLPSQEEETSPGAIRVDKAPVGENEARCVRVFLWGKSDRVLSMELWGSEFFVYLGRAVVRGIRAKVYEAIKSEPPYWLETPVNYLSSDGSQMSTRYSSNRNSPVLDESQKTSKLTTLVYVSEEKDDNNFGRVLQMEIYRSSDDYREFYERYNIQFFDFSWSLKSFSSQDVSYTSDLFSLADFCAENSIQASQVEMLLEQKQPDDKGKEPSSKALELIHLPRPRNWATMTALKRNLGVHVEMITDLQTRLVAPPRSRTSPLQMYVSFSAAERQTRKVILYFVGTGSYASNDGSIFWVPDFFQCFMLAAHHRTKIQFAWDPKIRKCYLARQTVTGDPDVPQKPFKASKEGNLEIYRLREQHFMSSSPIQLKSTEDFRFWPQNRTLMLYMGAGLDSQELENPVPMAIKLVKSEAFDSSEESELIYVINGFALEPQEGVTPATGDVSSLAECRFICHNDLSCRAFSFCIRGADVECMVSQFDLSAPSFKKRLEDEKKKKIVIEEGDRKFSFRRGLTCSIYNNRFLRYFEKARYARLRQFRSTKAVESAEECARECFATNLNSRSALQDGLSEALKQVADTSGFNELPVTSLEAIGRLADSSRLMRASVCTQFIFHDESLVELLPKEEREVLIRIAGSSKGGYCDLLLDDPDRSSIFESESMVGSYSYEMRFRDLYQEEFGISLLPSELTDQEFASYKVAQLGMRESVTDLEDAKLKLLLGLIQRGANMQEFFFHNRIEKCAEKCFKQTTGVWPACKSFDMVSMKDANGSVRVTCVFNTITRREAVANNRTDLIDTSVGERYHFEPKATVRDFLEIAEEADNIQRILSASASKSSASYFWSNLSVLLIVTAGTVSGLLLAVIVSYHLQRRGADRRLSQQSVAHILQAGLEMDKNDST